MLKTSQSTSSDVREIFHAKKGAKRLVLCHNNCVLLDNGDKSAPCAHVWQGKNRESTVQLHEVRFSSFSWRCHFSMVTLSSLPCMIYLDSRCLKLDMLCSHSKPTQEDDVLHETRVHTRRYYNNGRGWGRIDLSQWFSVGVWRSPWLEDANTTGLAYTICGKEEWDENLWSIMTLVSTDSSCESEGNHVELSEFGSGETRDRGYTLWTNTSSCFESFQKRRNYKLKSAWTKSYRTALGLHVGSVKSHWAFYYFRNFFWHCDRSSNAYLDHLERIFLLSHT